MSKLVSVFIIYTNSYLRNCEFSVSAVRSTLKEAVELIEEDKFQYLASWKIEHWTQNGKQLEWEYNPRVSGWIPEVKLNEKINI